MSDRESQTPRVFLVRHGETEWAKQGRYTGITNIDLTPAGVAQVSSTAKSLVGAGKLVDPTRLAKIIVSPRKRAIHTLELLLPSLSGEPEVTLTEEIAEWDYGDYEGMKTDEIRELRRQRDLDANRPWNIWSDGCEGGESKDEVNKRLDRIIVQIREIQRPYMNGEKPLDVLLRWLGLPVDFDLSMILAPGAIAVLSYKENDIEKPTFHLGIALPHGVATQ
ncbi:phosphoglycerate mutase-like protein [Colletotrichum somersetense]|nr:phosphoglycerate mutase-like protein [Colletotrichum somersetense]